MKYFDDYIRKALEQGKDVKLFLDSEESLGVIIDGLTFDGFAWECFEENIIKFTELEQEKFKELDKVFAEVDS